MIKYIVGSKIFCFASKIACSYSFCANYTFFIIEINEKARLQEKNKSVTENTIRKTTKTSNMHKNISNEFTRIMKWYTYYFFVHK